MATIVRLPRDPNDEILTQGLSRLGQGIGQYPAAKQKREKASSFMEAFFKDNPDILNAARDDDEGNVDIGSIQELYQLATIKQMLAKKQQQADVLQQDVWDINTGESSRVSIPESDLSDPRKLDKRLREEQNLTIFKPVDKDKGKGGKPTEKDKSIADYLASRGLPNNHNTRTRARHYLFGKSDAVRILEKEYSTRFGKDDAFFEGKNADRFDLATSQLEGLIMEDGLTPEQAANKAKQIADTVIPKEDFSAGTTAADKALNQGGGFDPIESIKGFFGGGKEEEGGTGGTEGTQTDENVETETIGTLNGQPIEVPVDMEDAVEIRDYIVKKYGVSKEEARRIILDFSSNQ